MDGIAGVQARIQDIISQFEGPPAQSPDSSTSSSGASSSHRLRDRARPGAGRFEHRRERERPGVERHAQPRRRRPGAVGEGLPHQARRAGHRSSNVQAITAWEQAEGTKAAFNPLATTQGGFTGETQFNSVGVKNYTSYQDGLDANVKVITNGLYRTSSPRSSRARTRWPSPRRSRPRRGEPAPAWSGSCRRRPSATEPAAGVEYVTF